MPTRFLPLVAALGIASAASARPPVVEIKAGKHDREPGIPLVCDLPVGLKEAGFARLERADRDEAIPAQVIPGGRTRIVWILEEALTKGESRTYTLNLRPPADDEENPRLSEQMNCLDTGATIELLAGAKSILHYNKTPTAAAEENEPIYSRTGYIHPLMSPAGKTITGDYAADHPHQHGLFFAWTNTTFEGRKINFWDQKSETARISYISTIKTQGGPVFAQFAVNHLHEDLTAPGGPKPVLGERWLVRAYQTGGDGFLVDIHSTQNCATESPLMINQYHYGGMAIRGADDWFIDDKEAKQPADFLTSEGMTRANGNHSTPDWVDLHGAYGDGKKAGVAIFGHPENFRAPQPVRLHPSKPYFVFTPQVESGFAIEPGTPYVSRYRYFIHDGPPDPKALERIWRDYSDPPEISITLQP